MNFNKNSGDVTPASKVIKMQSDIPLTDAGEPDIAAILAANGITDVDLSKVQVMKTGDKPKSSFFSKLLS